MQISLPSNLEKFVEDKVRAGQYTSPSEVMEEALLLLYERDTAPLESTPEYDAYLRREVQKGLDDLRAGRFVEVDEPGLHQLFEDIKRRGRERLAARFSEKT